MEDARPYDKEAESNPPPYYPQQASAPPNAGAAYGDGSVAAAWPPGPPAYSTDYKYPTSHAYSDQTNAMPQQQPYPATSMPLPPGGYYPQQGQQLVIVNQPGSIGWETAPLQNPPDDYMCYSIFVTICCCWLIGIFAIMRSSECRAAIASGDRVTAEIRSREARSKAHLALGLGIASIIASVVIFGVYFGAIVSSYSYP